jgi:hypothetical protein
MKHFELNPDKHIEPRYEVADFKIGDPVISEIDGQSGVVIEHPNPESRPQNTVFVKFEGHEYPLNCRADQLRAAQEAIIIPLRTGTHDR